MNQDPFAAIFTPDNLQRLFPESRSNDFFDALFGDASEGAYDIRLAYKGYDSRQKALLFELQLHKRPGKCLACNLTHGLPEVFSRHPLINLNGLAKEIDLLIGDRGTCTGWHLGSTDQISTEMHSIAYRVSLDS